MKFELTSRRLTVFTALLVVGAFAGSSAVTSDSGNGPHATANVVESSAVPDVPDVVEVDDDGIQAARSQAKSMIAEASTAPVQQTDVVAAADAQLSESRNSEGLSALVSARTAALKANESASFAAVRAGELTERDVRHAAQVQRERLERVRETIPRSASTLAGIVALAEAQNSLSSADGFLEQVPDILSLEEADKETRIGDAMAAVQAARTNIDDAEILHRSNRDKTQAQSGELNATAVFSNLHKAVASGVESATAGEPAASTHVADNAESYLRGAERDFDDGYRAAALVNLLKAKALLSATDELQSTPHPSAETNQSVPYATAIDARESALRSLTESLNNSARDPEALVLLQVAEDKIRAGDFHTGIAEGAGPSTEGQDNTRPYVMYTTAESIVEFVESANATLKTE